MQDRGKKVVITGVTGFVGSAIARAIAEDDIDLHALVRPTSDRWRVRDLPITWHIGDITVAESLQHVFDGADWVIHAAGILGQAGISESTYQRINGQGTRNVLAEISRSEGQPRVVVISSAGVLGPIVEDEGATVANESSPLAPSNPYERSKAAAEMIARDYAETGMPIIIVRPEFIYGPGDLHVLGLFRAIQRRQFFYIGHGRNTCHPTYIDDAVDGLLRCLKFGKPGEIYHITGPRVVTFRELARTIAVFEDVPVPRLSLPKRVVWTGTSILEFFASRAGITVPLSRTGVAFFSEDRRSTSSKAQKELDYVPRFDLQEGVKLTVAWYREQGLLR